MRRVVWISLRGVGVRCIASGIALPAVDAALRVARPCQRFPATAGAEPLDPHDPRVLWREYFSLEHNRPYYHKLVTNLTTFDVPDGFTTRFVSFHRRHGLSVDVEGRVHRCAATGSGAGPTPAAAGEEGGGAAAGAPLPPPGGLTLKQKLAAYGGSGLLLYVIVHNVLLACIFFSLYFLQVDLVGMARSYGFNVNGGRPKPADAEEVPAQKKYPSFWATLGISIILNKLLVPLELAATLMLAPVFVPRLQPFVTKFIPRIKQYFRQEV